MAAKDGMPRAPQVLVSVLLGIVIVAMVGFGLRVLYPAPVQDSAQLKILNDEQRAVDASRPLLGKTSGKHAAAFEKVAAEIAAKKAALLSGGRVWHRNSSMVLVVLGALFMGLSLIGAERLWALKDGLFLGGFFTTCYAVVWSFSGGPASTGFAVLAVALGVVLVIGYFRFAQWRKLNEVRSADVEPAPQAA